MKPFDSICVAVGMLIAAGLAVESWGASFIAKDGKPMAEIIIATNTPRAVKFAAEELQAYIEKISGAKLAITNEAGQDIPVKIYVGKSKYTEELKISDEGLKHGAYKIMSGNPPRADKWGGWLALIGQDKDFVPPEPHLRNRDDLPRVQAEWDKLTGDKFGFPHTQLYKFQGQGFWDYDAFGSLNAVYAFLRSLGVRWYMPGELGEVVPQKKSIELPAVDKTVHPDFALRYPSFMRFGVMPRENVLWQLRMGFNKGLDAIGLDIGHGMNRVMARDETKEAHPEYYALYNGKRDTVFRNTGRPCLSSEGLLQACIRYARKVFDIYGVPQVSTMPQDGYANLCQCELCKGKDSPERGAKGHMSDYVWSFENRVAQEVAKTHPDKKICCAAYGSYELAPTNIAMLSPNLLLTFCQARRDFYNPKIRQYYTDLRKAWMEKMPEKSRQFWVYEYYLHTRPGSVYGYMPVFYPHTIAEDMRSLKGPCLGEFIDMNWEGKFMAVDHLNLYVTAQYWWDAAQDIDALLDEYYELFYGPAKKEMKAFIEYSEANWMDLRKQPEKIDKMFDLLGKAQGKAPADSIYGRRMAFIADYMKPLNDLRAQLAKGREGNPEARAYAQLGKDFKLDGKLDEAFWNDMGGGGLSEVQTGTPPAFGTSFKAFWKDNAIVFGIQCRDVNTNLNIATVRNDDGNLWNGDCVELLIETQSHSYYQISINPAGAVADLDRKGGLETLWSSHAQIATSIGEDGWSVEILIPVADEGQDAVDPLNGLAGRRPTKTYPWYINVCRQRVRDSGKEASAWSPTGKNTFHDTLKFGMLFVE